jgi:SAM-dependent methyltransferase
MIPYELQTVANPSRLKRLSHRARFAQALRMIAPQPGQTILDYGTGDARLLTLLYKQEPRADYIGYEPVAEMNEQARRLLQAADVPARLLTTDTDLQGLQCDRVVCMEVFEHLDAPQLARAFNDLRTLLRPDGRLVLSVPVEIGAAALLKNTVRAVAGQRNENASWRHVAAATFGRTANIPRRSRAGYIDAHLGFDYRVLRTQLRAEGFSVEAETFAPVPLLGPALNSQVFWRCARR